MNKKRKIILASIMSSLMLVGGISYGVVELNNYHIEDKVDDNNYEIKINENKNLSIKLMSKTTNTDGSVTQTYSYEVVPENAKNVYFKFNVLFSESGSSAINYVFASQDYDNKTISVTCTKAFSEQIFINLKVFTGQDLVSGYLPDLDTVITVDYVKKITNWVDKDNNFIIGVDKGNISDDSASVSMTIEPNSGFVGPEYSLYTIDKNYDYHVTLYDMNCTYEPEGADEHSELIQNLVYGLIDSNTNGSAVLTQDDIWNASSESLYQSFIATCEDYFAYTLTYGVYCAESNTDFRGEVTIYFSLAGFDWSEYITPVNSITPETSGLVF